MGGSRISWRRPRLKRVVLFTLPLWVPIWMAAAATLERTRLERVNGWPAKGFDHYAQLQLSRFINGITTDTRVDRNRSVPVLNLHVPKASLEMLYSDIPLSGFRFQNAVVETSSGLETVKVRYRGDMTYHWFYPKKSWRLRADRMKPLPWGSDVDLVNPKDEEYLINWANPLVARKFHLLASVPDLIAVNINGEYHGLYLGSQRQDESSLRQWNEMPGEIVEADWSNTRSSAANILFKREPFLSDPVPWKPSILPTSNPYLWRHSAKMNPPYGWVGEHPLRSLIRVLNAGEYWKQPDRLLDENYMARFCAFVDLVGGWHYDDFHNLRLFFDPSMGKFKMLEGDTVGWTHSGISEEWPGFDISSNLIFHELLRNPVFNYEKNLYLYSKITDKDFITYIVHKMREAAERIAPFVRDDKLDKEGFNFRGPGNCAYSERIERMIGFLFDRTKNLRSHMDQVKVSFEFSDGILQLDVDGVSPCDRITLSFEGSIPRDLSIFRDVDMNGRYDELVDQPIDIVRTGEGSVQLIERLYPGRIGAVERFDFKRMMVQAPLSYVFLLRSKDDIPTISSISAVNSITGTQVAGVSARLSRVRTTESVHPWQLPARQKECTTIISGNQFHVESDWIINGNETVIFEPGVQVLLDPGVSILSYGKIICEGTEDRPISFGASHSQAAWGVIALQGDAASGSRFSHTSFTGGSDGKLRNVYYSGMVSVHRAHDVCFSHCTFSSNVIGDDTFHNVKGSVIISSCRFENTNGDAIDFDYGEGIIEKCEFDAVRNDGIDLMTSNPIIRNNIIRGCGDKGISIGEGSQPLVLDTKVDGCAIGLGIKDGSRPIVLQCEIHRCKVGISSYSKNRRSADGGHGIVCDTVIKECGEAIKSSQLSDLTVYGTNETNGTTSDPSVHNVSFVPCEKRICQLMRGFQERRHEIFRDVFNEDFLTGLNFWQFNQEYLKVTKKNFFSELRPVSRTNAVLRRDLSVPMAGGILIVDGRGKNAPVSITMHFCTHDNTIYHSSVELPSKWTRLVVPCPEESYDSLRMEISSDDGPIQLRAIELFDVEKKTNVPFRE